MSSSIQNAFVLALLALLAGGLVGCRGEDPTPDETGPPPGGGSGGAVTTGRTNAVNTSAPVDTGRQAGGGRRAWVAEKLDLRLRLHRSEVERGRPILARVELHNLGTHPVVLISPDELLAKRLHLRVNSVPRQLDLRSVRPPDRDPREMVLSTAEMVGADVDLLPLLRNTLAYEQGRVRVSAVYRGAADLLPESVAAWNRDGGEEVVSQPQLLDIVEPRWRAELGSSRETVGAVANLLITWRPGAPNTAEVKAAVADRGDDAIRALFYHVSGMSSMRRDALLRANRALEMLLLLAPDAAVVARSLAAVDAPAVAMARDLVLAEDAARLGGQKGRAATVISGMSVGGPESIWLSVELVDTERMPAEQYVLDGSGRLTVLRPGAGGGRRARRLTGAQVGELRDAVLATRPWLWQTARHRRLMGEGRVTVRLSAGGKTEFEIVLPEGEALDANPLARRLIDAFGSFADRVGSR